MEMNWRDIQLKDGVYVTKKIWEHNINLFILKDVTTLMRFQRLVFPILALIAPLAAILLGVLLDVTILALYIGSIIWFGLGIILFSALYD